MIGTIRINLIVAGVAFLITFVLSVGNNLFMITCLRSFYSFLILFVLTFGFRWVLGAVGGVNRFTSEDSDEAAAIDSHVGKKLDLETPDDDEATRQMMKANMGTIPDEDHLFTPLNPPKYASKNNLDPEQLAGALRRMSED
ncbi:hypothetical protein D3C73_791100 [compost metagenome]